MATHLVVLKPFLQFVKGDVITNADQVRDILLSDHQKFVLKVGSTNKTGG